MKILSLMSLFIVSCCLGGTNTSIEDSWLAILKTNDLSRVVDIMRTKQLTWPFLRIPNDSSAYEDPTTKSRELSNALLIKIKEFENDKTVSVSESISVYSTLRKTLAEAGGIQNISLANSVDIIALSRICSQLVADLHWYAEAEKQLGKLGIPSFSAQRLAEAFNAESVLAKRNELFDCTSETTANESLRAKLYDPMLAVSNMTKTNNNKYIPGRSQNALIYLRIRQVAVINEAFLPALILFAKKGGKIEDIRLDDITRFKEIMGSDRKKFSNKALGVRRLYASDLKSLIDEYSQGLKNSQLYHLGLQGTFK